MKYYRLCFCTLAIVATMLAAGSGLFAQQSLEDQTLSEMFRRDLAEAAQRYVQANLNRSGLNDSQKALWAKRLLECQAQVALRGTSEDLWAECEEQYQDLVLELQANPRIPWLNWQFARCLLLESQARLAQFVAAPANQQPRQKSLELVRKIVRLTEELDEDIRRRQPLAARQGASGDEEAPAEQLDQLRVESGLLRCEALLVRAKLYAKGSKDRVAAATDVERQASEILKTTSKSWASRGPLLIAHATALLELGQRARGLQVLAQILQEHGGASTLSQKAALVGIQELAASGETSRARQLLSFVGEGTVEFQLAELQLGLAEATKLPQAQRDARLGELVGLTKQIGDRFGGYWRNRAEALLIAAGTSAGASGTTANLDVMLAEVRQLLAAEQEAEAIQRLIEFRDNAVAARQGDVAIQLAKLTAALLGDRQKRWSEAATILEETCREFREEPEAAVAHARAVNARAEVLKLSQNNADDREAYEATLLQQLENWPDAAVTDQCQQWLFQWLEGKNRTAGYLSALRLRASKCTDVEVAFQVLQSWLAGLNEDLDPAAKQGAIEELESLLESTNRGPKFVDVSVVCAAAKTIGAWPTEDEIRDEASRLEDLQRKSPQLSQELLLALQVLNESRRKQMGSAELRAKLWKPGALNAEVQRLLATDLVTAIAEAEPNRRGRWVRTVMPTSWPDLLLAADNPQQKSAGYRCKLWRGDVSGALAGLAALVKEYPRDGWLLLQLGAALADSGRNRLADSMQVVRRVAATSKPGTELYVAARWQLVKNLLAAGEREKAIQSAKITLASPIGYPVYEERFRTVVDGP